VLLRVLRPPGVDVDVIDEHSHVILRDELLGIVDRSRWVVGVIPDGDVDLLAVNATQ
jgi:hypothetical protein